MKKTVRAFVAMLGLVGKHRRLRHQQQMSDPRIADLVAAGKVRFGTFPPQYSKDAATGKLKGPWVEVMRALGAHMGLSVVLTELQTPVKLVECLDTGPCDVGSLGFDPARADQVGGFTPSIHGGGVHLPGAGGLRDPQCRRPGRPGIRIAVVRNHASTLALARIVKQTEQVSAETPDAAFDLLRAGRDGRLGIRAARASGLFRQAVRLARARGQLWGPIFPALVVPKGQTARLAYISEFVEAAKASGVVKRAIDRAGQPGYRVAAPARP